VDDARRWLKQGNKVRVTIRFRGREIDYPDIALEDLREIAESLADIAAVESPPTLEGKNMSMVLAVVKPVKKKPSEKTAAPARKEAAVAAAKGADPKEETKKEPAGK